MKKLISVILIVSLALCCLYIPAFSASTIKLTGEVYPSEIVAGKTFSVYGTVSSDSALSSVTCSVYSSNGALQFTKTAYPGAASYSIHAIDSYMTFSKLSMGSYTYKIIASNESEKDVVLLSKAFRVISSNGTTIELTGYNYPASLTAGKTFSVSGTVKSVNTLTSVTAGVYTSGGTAKFEHTAKPGTSTYDIHNLDSYMTFSKLTAGSYVYKIKASDSSSQNVVLLQKSFTVADASKPDENLKSVLWNVIDLSYHNDIVSWDKIADTVDGVILRVGYRSLAGSRSIGSDVQFANFYKEASSRGLHIGCYFFSNALTVAEAEAEADFVLKKLKENGCKLDMPVYFDMETDAQYELSQSACTQVARAFCNRITASGYYVGIYCSKYFALDELYADQLGDIPFWIAQYASYCDYSGPYGMWQYSEKGSVPGISGNVDLDFCYYDYPSYIKEKGFNGYKPTPVVVTPTYKVKTADCSRVNESEKTISFVPSGMDTVAFSKKYLEYSSSVTVTFGNTVGGKIATGTTVIFKNGDKTLATYTVSVKGDIDANGVVNSSDALLALENSIEKIKLSGLKKISADVNDDGMINSSDALLILQISVKS